MKRVNAFTLVELLISVSIFTTILGTFFSVVSSVRRAESFRDNTAKLTQSASYGFEPIVRSIKDAEGLELVRNTSGQSMCVRGYYLRDADPALVGTGQVLTTLSIDRKRESNGEVTRTLVRRDYNLNSANQLTETTYQAPPTDVSQCTSIVWPLATSTRTLTGSDVLVRKLNFQGFVPLLRDQLPPGVVRQSPYMSLDFVVDYPGVGKKGIPPMSLKTTVVPTFVYGETRESL